MSTLFCSYTHITRLTTALIVVFTNLKHEQKRIVLNWIYVLRKRKTEVTKHTKSKDMNKMKIKKKNQGEGLGNINQIKSREIWTPPCRAQPKLTVGETTHTIREFKPHTISNVTNSHSLQENRGGRFAEPGDPVLWPHGESLQWWRWKAVLEASKYTISNCKYTHTHTHDNG